MITTEDVMPEPRIPTAEFPTLLGTIEGYGRNDEERADAIGVDAPKTVERLRRRLPAAMYPFTLGPKAPELLRVLLADVERRWRRDV
jgi:hypothetical protein